MTVHVNLHLLPSFNNGQKTAVVTLPDGATAGDLLRAMGIPRGDIGVIAAGGAHIKPDDVIRDGMTVDLYPIVAGE